MSTSFAARPVPLGMAEHLDKPVFTGACGASPPPGAKQNGHPKASGGSEQQLGPSSSTEDSQASEPELVEYSVSAPAVVSVSERCASLEWPAPTSTRSRILPSPKVLYTLQLQVCVEVLWDDWRQTWHPVGRGR